MSARPAARRSLPIDGVLLIDKPAGVSSNAVLQRVRRAYGAERAGHAGTLDPAATGLLVVCFGEATKFVQIATDSDKAYEATIVLGVTTATGDAEGAVTGRSEVDCSVAEVGRAMCALTGEIDQVPPMYSALKRDGRPYYAYAREGIELERAARRVRIDAFRLVEARMPVLATLIECSKGTYVRTLAEQLGERLECGAHLGGLRRTRVGRFDVAEAVLPERIEAASDAERMVLLRPIEVLVEGLPRIVLDDEPARRLADGQAVRMGDGQAVRPSDTADGAGAAADSARNGVPLAPSAAAAVFARDGRFLGLGEVDGDLLRPRRLVRGERARATGAQEPVPRG